MRGGARFKDLVKLCKRLSGISSRKLKVALLAEFLKGLPPEDIPIAARFITGKIFPEYSDENLDVGGALVWKVLKGRRAKQLLLAERTLTLFEVYEYFRRIASASGESSRKRKEILLSGLLNLLEDEDLDYLLRIMFGEMRIGVNEGVMLESIAEASGCPLPLVRRAYMFLGDIGDVAHKALLEGREGLEGVTLELFRPVKPMLADMALNLREVFREHGGVTALEYKYDGIRVQLHIKGDKVRIFTRRLTDITESVPEIVDVAGEALRADSAVLDGEIIGVVKGRPVPFQDIVRRVRRQKDLYLFLRRIPLKLKLFDLLYLDGKTLVDKKYSSRWNTLEEIADVDVLSKRIITGEIAEAREFMEKSLRDGHEGLVAKRLDSIYEPGHRGKKWLKIKPSDTVDCVIVAAEWGHGRRRGWLSDYHLAVLDSREGEYVVVGKTFKGLTDEEFREMTRRLLELKVSEAGNVVYVVPKIVVEVAYSEIQRSPKYKSGLALRFARITGIRWDRSPDDITTLEELEERYKKQFRFKAEVGV